MTLTYSTSPLSFARRQLEPQTVALGTAGIMLAFLLPTIIASLIDTHTLNGANLWLKPMHFELSLILHFFALAWLLPLVSDAWLRARTLRVSMQVAALSSVIEIVYILMQAARGEASHFNNSTPAAALLYALMGIGAVTIIVGSGIQGQAIWRSCENEGQKQVRRGAAFGLLFGSIATFVVAGYMGGQQSHLIDGPQSDAFGLPFLGWATRGGDLRVPHFFATHAMQALPIAGLFADRIGLKQRWVMPAAAVCYFAGVLALFVQALQGLPFIAIPF